MPKFVIERELTGAGKLPRQEIAGDLAEILRRAARDGPADPMRVQRHRRQIYVYIAPDEDAIKRTRARAFRQPHLTGAHHDRSDHGEVA
jgi:hypothetical protein